MKCFGWEAAVFQRLGRLRVEEQRLQERASRSNATLPEAQRKRRPTWLSPVNAKARSAHGSHNLGLPCFLGLALAGSGPSRPSFEMRQAEFAKLCMCLHDSSMTLRSSDHRPCGSASKPWQLAGIPASHLSSQW